MPRAKAAKVPEPTYREAYATLSRIVTELESGEADLDRVLPLLEEARAAYEACQGRIAAVTQAVGSAGWLESSADQAGGLSEDGEEE